MNSKLKITIVMIMWGSIGVFARSIEISSILLAFSRAIIALPVIYFFTRKSKQNVLMYLRSKSARPIILSGMLIGLNWVALFIAFRYSSVANATLLYNMCPIYVMLLAPFLLKEKLTNKQVVSVIVAFTGLLFIVVTSLDVGHVNMVGISLSLLSGVLYATIVLLNRKYVSDIPSESTTFIQLFMAAVVLLPLVLFDQPVTQWLSLDVKGLIMLLILGVFHTGIIYQMYFSCYKDLSSTSVALFSYLDPVFSIMFGLLLLGEPFGIFQIIGGTLILGSTLISLKNNEVEEVCEEAVV